MNNTNTSIKTFAIIAAFAVMFVMPSTIVRADDCTYGPVQPGSSVWGCIDGGSDNNDNNNNNNDNDALNVVTDSASSIDSDSATLRGEITDLDSDNDYERYFEWGTDEDDLDHTLTVSGTTDDEGEFSRTLSGLSNDHEYFFRACAEEDGGGDEDCGSVHSFTTDEENDNNNDDDNDNDSGNDDAVITTDATGVGYTTAILNGVVVGSQTVWFEWGTTTNLGNTTGSRYVSEDQSLVSINLSGLASNSSYFFRLVSNTGEEGDMKAFTTRAYGTNTTTNTNTNTPTTPTHTIMSDQYLNVDLIASGKDVKSGDVVMYQAVYQNLTNSTLKNINLIIDFPEGIDIENTESGTIAGQRIEFMIPTLAPKAQGSFAIETVVSSRTADKFLVGIIEAVYDHPSQDNTRIEVVDYAIVKVLRGGSTVSRTNQAGLALFAGTFFPKGLGGWLILAASIILLIVLARKLYKQKEEEEKKAEAAKPGLKIAK